MERNIERKRGGRLSAQHESLSTIERAVRAAQREVKPPSPLLPDEPNPLFDGEKGVNIKQVEIKRD